MHGLPSFHDPDVRTAREATEQLGLPIKLFGSCMHIFRMLTLHVKIWPDAFGECPELRS